MASACSGVLHCCIVQLIGDMAVIKLCMKQLITEFVSIIVNDDELQKGHDLHSSPIMSNSKWNVEGLVCDREVLLLVGTG